MRHLALLLVLLAGVLILAPTAHAATGGATLLPLPQPPPPPGKKAKPVPMTIKVDSTWVECNGYRPVRFTITPTPPLTVDRTVTLRMEPRSWSGGHPRIIMTQDVEVPAGVASVTAVMAVPQFEAWNTYSIDVLDDGVPVPELSVPTHRLTLNPNNNIWGDGASPTMLVLGAPKLAGNAFVPFGRTMESVVQVGLQPTVITTGAVTLPAGQLGAVQLGGGRFTGIPGIPSPADLPTRWIDYSGLDIVYVELSELEQFVRQQPEQWKAIREWISTGGNLWVGGVGRRAPTLVGEVTAYVPDKSISVSVAAKLGKGTTRHDLSIVKDETTFDRPAGAKAIEKGMQVSVWLDRQNPTQAARIAVVTDDAAEHKVWHGVEQLERLLEMPVVPTSEDDDTPGWTSPNEKGRFQGLQGVGNSNAGQVTTAAESPSAAAGRELPLFRTRSLGRGLVLAFGHDDPFSELAHNESWNWIFNSMGQERWSWYRRHGVTLQRENQDFWDFLIPGVGLAPVTAFQVLITLFVLTIGPVNFYLLRRWKKLNLIMITVPLSALAVTGALLMYALVADGLSVRARARSFTEIDQQRGEAVCWARLSYYAGLRPSQGLAFPTDTAIYPIDHEGQGNYYGQNRQRRVIDWRQKQYLGGGWLNARTPTQLLTVSTRPATHKLEVLETGSSPPVVENLLGTRIQQLILIDSKGEPFQAGDVAAEAKVSLTPATKEQTAEQLAKLLQINRPQRPPGMNANTYGLFGVRRRNYYYYNNAQDMDAVTQHTSILERGLNSLHDAGNRLQPRSYVALVDRSPEMSFGLESVNEEAGLHVIVGKW